MLRDDADIAALLNNATFNTGLKEFSHKIPRN